MILDAALLNTRHYKIRNKGKWGIQEKELRPPLYLGVVAIEKGVFGLPSTMVTNFSFNIYIVKHNFSKIMFDHWFVWKLKQC